MVDRRSRCRCRPRTSPTPAGGVRTSGSGRGVEAPRLKRSANRWWKRYHVRSSSSGTRKRLPDASTSASLRPESLRPSTSSSSSRAHRLTIDDSSRNWAVVRIEAAQNLLDQVVGEKPVAARRRRATAPLRRSRSANAVRWTPPAQPSQRSQHVGEDRSFGDLDTEVRRTPDPASSTLSASSFGPELDDVILEAPAGDADQSGCAAEQSHARPPTACCRRRRPVSPWRLRGAARARRR